MLARGCDLKEFCPDRKHFLLRMTFCVTDVAPSQLCVPLMLKSSAITPIKLCVSKREKRTEWQSCFNYSLSNVNILVLLLLVLIFVFIHYPVSNISCHLDGTVFVLSQNGTDLIYVGRIFGLKSSSKRQLFWRNAEQLQNPKYRVVLMQNKWTFPIKVFRPN